MCNRKLSVSVGALALCAIASATTLELLTLDDMIVKSTDIVRCRVMSASASFRGIPGRGGAIYTHYTVAVTNRWKGKNATQMDVAVPGGVAQGIRQIASGSPTPQIGSEYVMFLWTSRSGLTQIIGLSQGLFKIETITGTTYLTRAPADALILDPKTGQPVQDSNMTISLPDLVTRIGQDLAAAK
jgi:hypothetical protein